MPTYEFCCNDTGKRFEIKCSYAEYDPSSVTSPFTGSTNVSRIIRRVRVMRSEGSRWDRMMDGDENAMDELEASFDEDDPRQLGRALRHFGKHMDEDMGPEFGEVIDRLESGQSPEEIEQTLAFDDGGDAL